MTIDFNGLQSASANTSKSRKQTLSDESGTQPAKPDSHGAPGSESDSVNLSTVARNLQEIEDRVSQSTPIDQKRIDELKLQLENGSFEINTQSIASKMVDIDDLL